MTERNEYAFTIKDGPDNTYWIMAEPRNGNLALLKGGFIGFDLQEGTTREQAREIADQMRRIRGLSFTK